MIIYSFEGGLLSLEEGNIVAVGFEEGLCLFKGHLLLLCELSDDLCPLLVCSHCIRHIAVEFIEKFLTFSLRCLCLLNELGMLELSTQKFQRLQLAPDIFYLLLALLTNPIKRFVPVLALVQPHK